MELKMSQEGGVVHNGQTKVTIIPVRYIQPSIPLAPYHGLVASNVFW